jgi:hypothetical protein
VCLLNVSCCGVRGLTSSPLTEVSAPNEKPMCSEPSSRMSFTGRILSAFLGQWSRDAGQGVAQCGGLVLHKSFLRMVVWICRTYENVEREAALAPGLRDFFRSCAVWRLTKMDRIFPSTGVRVRSLRFAGRRGRGTVRCLCVKPLCHSVVLLAGFFWILFRLFHICHWRTVIYHWRDWRIIIRGQGPGLVTSLVFFS